MLKRILFLAGLVLVSTAAIYPAPPILKRAELGFAVSSNAALQTYKSTDFTSLTRLGFYASDDSPRVIFTSTNAACTLNSGNGDNGTQVKLADGNCAVAALPSVTRLTPMIWGAKGDGTTDDTAAVQNAVTAAEMAGEPLWLDDGYHKYLLSSTVVSTKTPDLEGVTGRQGGLLFPGGNFVCPSGIVVNSNILALQIKGNASGPSSYIVRNICFQMAPNSNTRQAGAAISVGTIPGGSQIGGLLEGNTIIYPYEGIQVDSDVGNTQTATQQIVLRDNIVRAPTHIGIVWGRNTFNDGTSGTLDNNMVSCDAVTGAFAIGLAAFDGDFDMSHKNNGTGVCFIGTEIIPGTVGTHGQNFGAHFWNVIGDSEGTVTPNSGTAHSFYVEPQTNLGTVAFLTLTGAWASGGTSAAHIAPVLIQNTHGGTITNVTMNGLTVRSGGTANPLIDIEGHVTNLTLNGSLVCAWNNGTVTTGVKLNFAGSGAEGRYIITNNQIGDCEDGSGASMTTGMSITDNGAATRLTITGNQFAGTATPVAWTPGANAIANIFGNMGIDDVYVTVPSAATISLPNVYPTYFLSGSTAFTAITNSAWTSREIKLIPLAAITYTFANGTVGTICGGSLNMTAGTPYSFKWFGAGIGSCWAHIQ